MIGIEPDGTPRLQQRSTNELVERVVRNSDIFCSLLFDHTSRTLRVIDFYGGNFKNKHSYLEHVSIAEGMRKVFTLIELGDVPGWRRIGYVREGTVPGYYKRSDAHIMSRIFDADWAGPPSGQALTQRSSFLAEVATAGEQLAALNGARIKSELAERPAALDAINAELARLRASPRRGKPAADQPGRSGRAPRKAAALFGQFSRNTEHFYWIAQNRRTKQRNVYGVEYQDCFGNAKISMYFTPDSRAGRTMARQGLTDFVDWLGGIGAVAIFALVRADDREQNAVYASAGFRNSGWMNQQLLTNGCPVDQVLWTMKMTGFSPYGARSGDAGAHRPSA